VSSSIFRRPWIVRVAANYQTLINNALREYIRGTRLETVVRRAVRQEVGAIKEALIKTA
jgi:hypothetical protein